MEQHFQDVAQKVMNDKYSDSFAATQKLSPQQCRKIMSFKIISTVNPINSMKTRGNLSCTLRMKEKIEIIDNSRRRYSRLINACPEMYRACRHIPKFHRFNQRWWSFDESKVTNFVYSKFNHEGKTVSSRSKNISKRRRSQHLRRFFWCRITSSFLVISINYISYIVYTYYIHSIYSIYVVYI